MTNMRHGHAADRYHYISKSKPPLLSFEIKMARYPDVKTAGNEISQIFFIFFFPLLARIKRRSLWTSVAMILSALGSLWFQYCAVFNDFNFRDCLGNNFYVGFEFQALSPCRNFSLCSSIPPWGQDQV